MEETIITPQFSTLFAVCTSLTDYTALNTLIGTAKNYPDTVSDTLNYANPEPVVSWDGNYYLEVTTRVQRDYPATLEGITLVDVIPDEVVETAPEL